jgi:secondary thiamine-phosphate synthase enzyme
MRQHFDTVHVATRRGLTDVTDAVSERLRASGLRDGLCTVFIRHTSASLVIQENADPAARRDLEAFLDRLVPEGDALYTHTAEGDDDMPSHVKAALTRTSEQIPFRGGELLLGTWQGLYVWEHRSGRHRRELALHFVGE